MGIIKSQLLGFDLGNQQPHIRSSSDKKRRKEKEKPEGSKAELAL